MGGFERQVQGGLSILIDIRDEAQPCCQGANRDGKGADAIRFVTILYLLLLLLLLLTFLLCLISEIVVYQQIAGSDVTIFNLSELNGNITGESLGRPSHIRVVLLA